MTEPTWEAMREALLDHLKWLSAYVTDPRIRRHMDAVEACLHKAAREQLLQEVNADLRRRLSDAEDLATRGQAVAAMLSYCKGHGCLGYEYMRHLALKAPDVTHAPPAGRK